MSSWKAEIVVLAVLLCRSQVYSRRLTIQSEDIELSNKKVILGVNHIAESALLYALCEINGETADCEIHLKNNAFDDPEDKCSCDTHVVSQLGKLDLLRVELWGINRAIFAWRDIYSNEQQGQLYIETINMLNCDTNVNQFPIDIRNDQISQEYIVTSQFNYHVTFINQGICNYHICMMTVDLHGNAIFPQPWIFSTDRIHTLETIEYSSKKLLISIAENDDYRVELYLLNDTEKQFVTSFDYAKYIGWSSTNGIISFCHLNKCKRYNYAGELQTETTLRIYPYNPTTYLTLYNTLDGGHLALICHDEINSFYQIVKIGHDGKDKYVYNLPNVKCYEPFRRRSGKFYENGNGEYCLALFHTISIVSAKFDSYCFPD